ncbi:hypothetical protein HLRTI_000939 [Halorhabdus tiamatea SARL4B]|uniref:Uncharacterized protein n=1 Tax=Halorhabdus tiamatea SARL4B TaxID=1033806 RepID=U2E580_9EURY|nr:hypothetical protein HLRTI_000939 [Halorhabdus tiamatea SARL4B]
MPISRDDLCDGERVRELHREAQLSDKVGDNPVMALDFYLRHEYEKDGNIRICDVATALGRFTDVDPHDSLKSSAMVARIHRESERS